MYLKKARARVLRTGERFRGSLPTGSDWRAWTRASEAKTPEQAADCKWN